jgi:hypothetical protein
VQKARWARGLKEAQDQLAADRTAVEQEKTGLAKLRESLGRRLQKISDAAAAA